MLYPPGHLHSPQSRALHLWISQDVKVREEGAALIAPDILFLIREVSIRMGLLKNLNRCWDYTPGIFFFFSVYRKTGPVAHGPSPSHNHGHSCTAQRQRSKMFGLRWSSKAASSQQFLSPCLSPAVTEDSALRVNIPTLRQALRCIRHKCLLCH